ncbi:SGNH/GDSL hydrolase family protein [uncultured Algibacter sp.]|uniref:SGNH/GDSL hydrolase family protein n=1 Tax=uncultured Algibacter sp. TaxID=298659 RepID=UPI002624FA64|nr:SGNH/GDSL hydrolase family protein [uncultured Algibacter sp.]
MDSVKYVSTFLVSICLLCQLQSQSKKTEFNILFIGNSLTYTNNLPLLVKKQAKKLGITINTKMIAEPNYTLPDHWHEGKAQKLIKSKTFDFLIVQQGPSSQAEGKQMLLEYGEKYSLLCKKNQVKLAYFMVWPSLQYYHTFEGVIKNHQLAAKANNAILCPVGDIWRKYFNTTNYYDYYGSDGFHPSKKGSEIAAKVIIESLFGK